MSNDRLLGLRAILKTAFLWGAACGATGGGLVTLWVLFVPGPGVESLPERVGMALFAGFSMGVRFGLAGAVIGTLFGAALRFGFRGRKFAELNPLKFAALGAVVGGVGIPLFYQMLNVLTDGHTIAWNLVLDDSVWASIFGAAAGAGSILLARRAAALPAEARADELGAVDELRGIPAIGKGEKSRAEL